MVAWKHRNSIQLQIVSKNADYQRPSVSHLAGFRIYLVIPYFGEMYFFKTYCLQNLMGLEHADFQSTTSFLPILLNSRNIHVPASLEKYCIRKKIFSRMINLAFKLQPSIRNSTNRVFGIVLSSIDVIFNTVMYHTLRLSKFLLILQQWFSQQKLVATVQFGFSYSLVEEFEQLQ